MSWSILHYLITRGIGFLAVPLLLSGCVFYADLTLYADERWEYREVTEFTQDEDVSLGPLLEQDIAEKKLLASEHISVESSREIDGTTVRYTTIIKGQGHDRLVEILDNINEGQSATIETDSNGQITIEIAQGDTSMAGAVQYQFRLHARRIVESNAPDVEGRTAIWKSADIAARDISTIRATVVPASNNPNLGLLPLLIVVGGLLVGAGSFVLFRLRKKHDGSGQG